MYGSTNLCGFMAYTDAVSGGTGAGPSGDGCDDPLTDPYWDNVELLCWCNGVDDGITFTDETGNYGNAGVPSGLVTTQSGTKKFGSSAANFPGEVSQALTWGDVGNFNFLDDGTLSFTAELWIKTPNDRVALFATCDGATNQRGVFFHLRDGNGIGLHIYDGGGTATIALNTAPAFDIKDNEWHHVVFQYDTAEASKYQIFVDGVLQASGNITGAYPDMDHLYALHNGRAPSAVGYSKACSMDDIRITKGIARYPASGFTPPCRQFPNTD
jgi:hypothetical protein